MTTPVPSAELWRRSRYERGGSGFIDRQFLESFWGSGPTHRFDPVLKRDDHVGANHVGACAPHHR